MTAASTAGRPSVPAKIHPIVRSFLSRRDILDEVLATAGSPVNLVFPQVFADNVAAIQGVLGRYALRHRINYAHKVNQSSAFVRAAEHAGICIDIASPGELANAIDCGFPSDRIEATGPKGEAFLAELVRCGVTINIDNLWELDRVAHLAAADRVSVLLRLSGFDDHVSRFGVPLDHAQHGLDLLCHHRNTVEFKGFSFHLDSGEVRDRLHALDACLMLVEHAYARGLPPSVINIGGGFRQVFIADADRFDAYVRALRDGLAGQGEPLTWAGNTFGYQTGGTSVQGTPTFHKYANTAPASDVLCELLDAPRPRHGARSIAQLLTDNLQELWIEPGKALVDHAGVTVASVEFVKEAADGSTLVNLDLSRDTVTPTDQEVMVDPIVIHQDPPTPNAPLGVYFAGRLCLERDMITNHKTWLPSRPCPGDIVAFPNTAAYNMDLSAGTATLRPPVPKVAVTAQDGGFAFCPDAEYRP